MKDGAQPSGGRPIRLAILGSQGIPARYGGYETFAEQLSVRLVRLGCEVTVFCPVARNHDLPPDYEGVRLEGVPLRTDSPLGNLLFDIQSLIQCSGRFDVAYMLGHSASPFCFLPRLFGTKVWTNLDGLEWKRAKWNLAARTILRVTESLAGLTSDRLIADAQAIADHYRSAYVWRTPLSFIPYGVDLDHPPNRVKGAYPTEDYYLLVARLEPENQIREIIQGFLASATTRPLVIVGNLLRTQYVKELLQYSSNRVHFHGPVYDPDLLWSLRCDAFAAFHGHTVGGTNPSLLEAMAAGRPVIAHDNPFNREVGGTALAYFLDYQGIPEQLYRLESFVDEALSDTRVQLHARLSSAYSWDQVTQQYWELLHQECQEL